MVQCRRTVEKWKMMVFPQKIEGALWASYSPSIDLCGEDTRGSGPGSETQRGQRGFTGIWFWAVFLQLLCGLRSGGIGGILEPSTLQESHVELPRGAVSLFILAQNLNLSMLSAKTELATSFRSTIQEDIAQNLGPGFLPEHVDVRLLAESAAIPVTITAPKGVSCYDLHRWLCNKPLRWGAGNKLGTLEGFNAICLSPSWCLSTVGMPSIVADEASTTVSGGSPLDDGKGTNLAQDLPAIPDEQDLILPRSLQRSGHTPRDGPQRKVSPKKRPLPKAGRCWSMWFFFLKCQVFQSSYAICYVMLCYVIIATYSITFGSITSH